MKDLTLDPCSTLPLKHQAWFALLAFIVVACAPAKYEWVSYSGVSPTMSLEQAKDVCEFAEREAKQKEESRINQNKSTYSTTYNYGNTSRTVTRKSSGGFWGGLADGLRANRSGSKAFNACMAERGWHHQKTATSQQTSKPSQEPSVVPSQIRGIDIRPIAVSWEGHGELLAGTVQLEQATGRGRISVTLPNNEGSCRGEFQYHDMRSGTWFVRCTKGQYATGEFLAYGRNKGASGIGRDSIGNRVSYTIGAPN